jgi:hypothetical protein
MAEQEKWNTKYFRQIISTVLGVAAAFTAFVSIIPQFARRLSDTYIEISKVPIIGIVSVFILLGFSLIGTYLFVILRSRITDTASSLGYSSGSTPEADRRSERNDHYIPSDRLSPLLIARIRLIDHINTLRNNAVTNLFIGIGIAIVGVMILFWAIIQIGSIQLDDAHSVDTARVVALVMFPKLSITLFIQIFSYFFLAMYRSNQQEIRYFQNEITLIDSFASALIASDGNAAALKIVLVALSKNERNIVMKKGEKPIISTDEIELMNAMSVLSKLKDNTHLSE